MNDLKNYHMSGVVVKLALIKPFDMNRGSFITLTVQQTFPSQKTPYRNGPEGLNNV
jgi:hypothetical protein